MSGQVGLYQQRGLTQSVKAVSAIPKWTPELDLVSPIDGTACIPGFVQWVNWNGWGPRHQALDFAAYLNQRNECVIGLPSETQIRAVADARVHKVFDDNINGSYSKYIKLEHGERGSRLFSEYHHVVPLVEHGQKVKKGQVIATLHKDPGEKKGRLVHLHFSLTQFWSDCRVNPVEVFPGLVQLEAEPQGEKNFRVLQLENQPTVVIANFEELSINNWKPWVPPGF